MNFLDRLITTLSPRSGLQRRKARLANQAFDKVSKRLYEAATHNHRTEGWIAPQTSANQENLRAGETLRARSRELIRNNPYASRALRIWTSNAIGHGIIPQIKCENEFKRNQIETEFEAWAETTDCDVEGRKNFYEIQSLVFSSVIESGEVLTRLWRRDSYKKANFQLQVLEIDHLDQWKHQETEKYFTQGGIEFSQSRGERMAYWLFAEHPGDQRTFVSSRGLSGRVSGISSFRIPASEILHIYRQDRPGQNFGVPWCAPILTRLKDFDGFEDAQLRRQIVAAAYAGFLEDIEPPLDVKADNHTTTSKIMSGTIQHMPPGKRITFNSPPDSGANYSAYSSHILHAIAVGYGIPYESLTGDFSQVNFSSGRMGYLEFQRQLDHVRFNMFIPQFCVPVWNCFERYLNLKGISTCDVKTNWVPPRREMIDPVSETQAMTQMIRSGLITLSDAVTQFGVDPMDHFQELSQVNSVLDEYGLKLDSDPRYLSQAGKNQMGSQKKERTQTQGNRCKTQ